MIMMTVLGIAVALTLSNFQVASRVEFLHCVSGIVLMQYLAIERTVLVAVTFIRHPINTSEPGSFSIVYSSKLRCR